LILELKDRASLGISDIYAYTTVGNHIRAVGMVILSPNSSLAGGSPITVNLYLMRNGSVLAITDAPGLSPVNEARGEVILNDLCEPPSEVRLTEARLPCIEGLGADVGICVVEELGLTNAKSCYRGTIRDLDHLIRVITEVALVSRLRGNCDNLEELLRVVKWGYSTR
jgi:hypothetical protein